jgi:hypothetical protein
MKQETLPGEGMKPKIHKDISDAAEKFLDAKADAKAIRGRVDERTDELIRAMRKHKLPAYRDTARGLFVTVEDDTKVRVKKSSPGEDDEQT